MSIKRTIITTVVALALVAVVAPVVAQATTVADLQAMIAQLTAQLAQLSGTSTTTTVGTGACAGVTFNRNLTVGSKGNDVKCLQSILNQSAATQVATTGAGAPGLETTTFGPKTLVAVKKFQTANGLTPANQVGPLTRAKLNASIGTVVVTPGQPPVVVPTGAGLSVMVAYDNPSSSTIVAGQAIAPLLRLTFANGDNAPVNVTSVELNRIGVSADTDLQNVYLFQGATRLTDAASVSSGLVSFNAPNGLFTVQAGSSVEITVASDIYSSLSAGETLGIQLASASNVTTNASSVKGNFPVNGNLMTTVAAPSTIGNVYVVSSSLTPVTGCTQSTCTVDPQNDYPVYQENYSVGNHAVNLTRLALREIGSVNYSDVRNFRLYVDGVQAGTAVASLDSNGYVTFDLTSNPLPLTTATHVVKVLADIVGGSSRSFSFSLQNASDATFFETQYNVNVLLHKDTSSGSFTSQTTGTSGVNSGLITVAKTTDSPSGNIVNTASNSTLARYTLTASGEAVKVSSLNAAVVCPAGVTTTGIGLRNGAIYANGVQVGSTATLQCASSTSDSSHYQTYNLGSSLIVTPGSPVTLEIRADIYAVNSGANYVGTNSDGSLKAGTDSVTAILVGQTSNAQGQVSLSTTGVPNGATTVVIGNSLAVQSGSLALSKYTAYTNQTLVATGQNLKLADFVLSSTTTEAVNINTIALSLNTITATNVTNLYVTYGNNTTTTKASTSSTADANSWSVNYTLPAGQSVDVSVYGTVANGYTNGTASYIGALVTGTTANSTTTVYSGASGTAADVSGQNLYFSAGSLSEDAHLTLQPGLVSTGSSNATAIVAAKYTITSSYDNYTITEMKVAVPSGSDAIIASAALYDDATGTLLGSSQSSLTGGYYYFTGLNLVVPSNTSKTVDVKYTLATPNAVASTQLKDVKSTLSYIRYTSGSGVQSALTAVSGVAGNKIYVFKSMPTFAISNLTSSEQTGLANAATEIPLYRFTVAAPASGDVSIKQMKLDIAMTTPSGTATMTGFKLYRNGNQVTNVAIMKTDNTSLTTTNTITSGSTNTVVVLFTGTTTPEETIAAGTTNTYELRATTAGFITSSGTHGSASVKLDGGDTIAAADDTTPLYYDYGTDSTVHQLASAAAGTNNTTENLIWSDRNATPGHVSDVNGGHASSADWTNSMSTYLGLPLSNQSLTTP